MILNSGRHAQPDPQSCRVRSLGGKGGSPKTNNSSRDQNKTEQCDAKASRQQCRSGISTSPTPCCESLRQSSKQVQTTVVLWRRLAHAGGAIETFNQQPCSPESCHSVTLARVLLFVKAGHFSQKRSLQQSHFRGRKHMAFWTPRSRPPQFSTWMSVSSFRPFVVSWFLANF